MIFFNARPINHHVIKNGNKVFPGKRASQQTLIPHIKMNLTLLFLKWLPARCD